MGKVRDFLLPWVTGRTALLGPEFAQQYRCLVLDWFFRFFPFLGSGLHYDILVPLHAWFLGDVATVQLLLSLAIAFFACNALKDLLMLPRPRASVREGPGDGVVALETSYLEEYGFPSTHAAAGVVWSRALCELLRKPPLLAGLSTLFGAAISSPSSAGGFRSSPQVAVAEDSAVLQLVAKHAPSVAAAYASLVSFSRLYLGVHSLLDLAGGLTIGVCSIALVDFFVMPAFMEVASDPNASWTVGLFPLFPSSNGEEEEEEAAAGGASTDALLRRLFVTVPPSVVAAGGLMVLLAAAFPDKRAGRPSYKDNLAMAGVACGALMVIGQRLAASSAPPATVPPLAPVRETFAAIAAASRAFFERRAHRGGDRHGGGGGGGGGGEGGEISSAAQEVQRWLVVGGGTARLGWGGNPGVWAVITVAMASNFALLALLGAATAAAVALAERAAGFRAGLFRLARYAAVGAFVAAAARDGTCHLAVQQQQGSDDGGAAALVGGILDCSPLFAWFSS